MSLIFTRASEFVPYLVYCSFGIIHSQYDIFYDVSRWHSMIALAVSQRNADGHLSVRLTGLTCGSS
jgi:hypothetical protein